jgi:hypothetical protein
MNFFLFEAAELICGIKTKRMRLQLGCLSSANLKEREEVLVSFTMFAYLAGMPLI